ncbi:hypothetical protein N431DRAFT_141606 [Stipitochalara longipes BDJ]|nr:hypothetical protein N431DRAFT_141606 [Stipitochalara longipes BDJ]
MIFDNGGHEKGVEFKYSIQLAPTKAVMSKIVESVWVNVINTGVDLGGLPHEFQDLHVHLLNANNFSAIAMGIFRSAGDLLMESPHFFGDITAWILAHFHGQFQVSVGRQIISQKSLGPDSRKLRYLVGERCDNLNSCLESSVKLAEVISDHATVFVRTSIRYSDHPTPQSHRRRHFYTSGPCEPLEDMSLIPGRQPIFVNHQQQNTSKALAKQVLNWLMRVPLDSRNIVESILKSCSKLLLAVRPKKLVA